MSERKLAKTIVLHIGTEKTGTTTLQSIGKSNRVWLEKRGILYPTTPGAANHVRLAVFACRPGRCMDLRRRQNLSSVEDYQAFKKSFPRDLTKEIRLANADTVWMSNEHLSSRIRRVPEIMRLLQILRPLAEKLRVIIYLRHQPELFLSAYSTGVKSGNDRDLTAPVTGQEHFYNYGNLLDKWSGCVGREAITVRVYEPDQMVSGDVVADFFSIIGIVPDNGFLLPTVLNRRLDGGALYFLRIFNRFVPATIDEQVNVERGDVAELLERMSSGTKITAPASTMNAIARLFAASNSYVAREYLGREDGKLFKEFIYSDHDNVPALPLARAKELALALGREKQRQAQTLLMKLTESSILADRESAELFEAQVHEASNVEQAIEAGGKLWCFYQKVLLTARNAMRFRKEEMPLAAVQHSNIG